MRPKATKQNSFSPSQMEIMKSLPHLSFSKATLRQIQIIDAAIYCYAHFGFVESTFERIAKQAKLSRPLIFHYFNDKSEIFDAAVNYARATYQQLVIEGVSQGKSGKERFSKYLEYCFEWHKRYPNHVKLWVVFLHCCATQEKYRNINTGFAQMGLDRIANLILGIEENKNLSESQAQHRARNIQALITGALAQINSESPETFPKDYIKNICSLCMELATAK